MLNLRNNFWLSLGFVVAIICLGMYLQSKITEGFEAPYFIPWGDAQSASDQSRSAWWREYNNGPTYSQPGKEPYYNSGWYWWPHYSKEYFGRYWNAHGVAK